MIYHIYISNESDARGAFHVGPMLCGMDPCAESQFSLNVYETARRINDNTWCPKCVERTDLAILATTDLEGSEAPCNCGQATRPPWDNGHTDECPQQEEWRKAKYLCHNCGKSGYGGRTGGPGHC